MDKDLIDQAIQCLKIRDVYLHESEASVHQNFTTSIVIIDESTPHQNKHMVRASSIIRDADDEQAMLFRVFVDLGFRWVLEDQDDDEPEDLEKEAVLAEVTAVFVAEYYMFNEPSNEALDEFALHNASYHVWPYWREYLSANLVRMRLPKHTIPTYLAPTNPSDIS